MGLRALDHERKRQILRAQAAFEARERLARRLAERGVYVFGELTVPSEPEGETPRSSAEPSA